MLGLLIFHSVSEFRICIYNSNENECKRDDYKGKKDLGSFLGLDKEHVKSYLHGIGYDISAKPDLNIDYEGHDPEIQNHTDAGILNKFNDSDFNPLIIFNSMSETPNKAITHAPNTEYCKCEYHGYIIRVHNEFKCDTLKIYNCMGKRDTVYYFYIFDYIGPASFLHSISKSDTFYTINHVQFRGDEVFNVINQDIKLQIKGSITFDDVNVYSEIEIKDKYSVDCYCLNISKSDKIYQFLAALSNENSGLDLKFNKPKESPATVTFDTYNESFQHGDSLCIKSIHLIGTSNESWIKLNIKKSSIFELTKSKYSDIFISDEFKYDSITVEFVNDESISAAIHMLNWASKTNIILKKDVNIKLMYMNSLPTIKMSLAQDITEAKFHATTYNNTNQLYSSSFKIQKGITFEIGKVTNYIITDNKINMKLILEGFGSDNNKYQCGTMKINSLEPETMDWKAFSISIEHKQDVFYTPSNLEQYFDSSYDVLITNSTRTIKFTLDNDINNPGFYKKQTLMEYETSNIENSDMSTFKIKFDKNRFNKLSFLLCLTYNENFCHEDDMYYNIYYYIQNNNKATEAEALTKVVKLASKADGFNSIRITFKLDKTNLVNFGFDIPKLDCSELQNSMKSKPFEVICIKNYSPFNILNLKQMNGPIRFFGIILNSDLQKDTIEFNENSIVTFDHSFINNSADYNPELSDKVTFNYNLDDLGFEYASDKSVGINETRYLTVFNAKVNMYGLDPLNFAELDYGNNTELQIRVVAAENVIPFKLRVKASIVTFTFDYSNNPEFLDKDNHRFRIRYTGETTAQNIVKVNVTNFKGCAESVCDNHDWPDDFRNEEYMILTNLTNTSFISLQNFTGLQIKNIPYVVSNKLASRMFNSISEFKLSSDRNNLLEVQFPDIAFDTLFNPEENKTSGIKGCKAIFNNLEIRFNTTSAFEALQVTESLIMYPGAVLQRFSPESASSGSDSSSSDSETGSSDSDSTSGSSSSSSATDTSESSSTSKRKIKGEETTVAEGDSAGTNKFCNVFGMKVEMRWNAELHSKIILDDDCPTQTGQTNFTFNYDSTILRKVFNVTEFRSNYMNSSKVILHGFEPSSETEKFLNGSYVFGPPKGTDNDYDRYKPPMVIEFSGDQYLLKANDTYIKEMENTSMTNTIQQIGYSAQAFPHENKNINGLILIIVVSLIFIIVVVVIWIVMYFLYKDTLVQLSDSFSSYYSSKSSTESSSSSRSRKKNTSDSGSGDSV